MPPDAVQLLEKDHKEAQDLFEKITNNRGRDRERMFQKLATDLKVHVRIEEEIFYPRIQELMGETIPQELLETQEVEENEAAALLEELETLGVEHGDFDRRFAELRRMEEQHAIKDENERLFPLVRQHVDAQELRRLGEEMQRAHERLHRELQPPTAR